MRMSTGLGRCFGVHPCGLIVVDDDISAPGPCGRGWVPALESIANRPIVEHVFEALELAGIEDILLASAAGACTEIRECLDARAERTGHRIRYLEQDAPLDLAGALKLAAPAIGDTPCLVHRATGLLDEPLRRFVDRWGDRPDVTLIVHQAPRGEERLIPAAQSMLRLSQFRADCALGMAGVWQFGPGALPLVAAAPRPFSSDADLTLHSKRIEQAGGSFHVKVAATWRQYRADPLDLLDLNRIALDRLEAGLRRPCNNGNRIEGRVWIHEAASVRASVIVGPCVIGAGARIADSYIGPYTAIGERARVEGAEVERSIVSPGASVMHVGARVMASVVGPNARVFRDFSLPRALRLQVGAGTEVALC
jgi:glucose-1-phosphate thymidylyltransferase